MPQLDIFIWFPQLLFFILIFMFFYYLSSYFFLPRVYKILSFRESKLNFIYTEITLLNKNLINFQLSNIVKLHFVYNTFLNIFNLFVDILSFKNIIRK